MHLLSIKQNFFLSSCFFSAAETKTKSEHTTWVIYSEFPFFCSPGYSVPDSTVWPYQLLQTNSSAVAEEYWLFPYLSAQVFLGKRGLHMSPASLFLTTLLPVWSGDSVPVAGSQCHERCLHPKAAFPFFCTNGQKAFHMKTADQGFF